MIIDCQSCPGRLIRPGATTNECGDCVVTFLLNQPAELSEGEVKALAVLADADLVPELRLRAQ